TLLQEDVATGVGDNSAGRGHKGVRARCIWIVVIVSAIAHAVIAVVDTRIGRPPSHTASKLVAYVSKRLLRGSCLMCQTGALYALAPQTWSFTSISESNR